ncbi:MAG: acetolactate synthase large subunit [Halobacteriota archaeon]|nr:acetolactate synthase large subunit [Halobacteriota archaeon]
MSGAKAMVKSLKEEGVEVIFGYPGGVVLPLYDELFVSDIRHILVRHEQGAAHAADGYSRATGKVGVCLATSGPGATNLVTGIANAYMDSIPIVAITGQVATSMIGNDAFQEANITGITIPVTKHNYLVTDGNELPKIIKEAFHIASTGRPGPVLIDIPTDVFKNEIDYKIPKSANVTGYKPKTKGHSMQIKRASELIKKSHSPLIFAGGGVITSGAHKELTRLAERIGAPVTTTLMGKGSFPETSHLSLGMLGMHGTKYANYAMSATDLIVAVGVRFDDRVTGKIDEFAKGAKVIHIDIDPAEIGKVVNVDVPIVGDAKNVLAELLERVEKCENKKWDEQIHKWKRGMPLTYEEDGLKPQYVVEQIYEACPDAIITTEVGQNQMWAAQYFKYTAPRTLVTSGGLGTMGFGLPSAIGAKVGCPDRTVFDIAGDGSFMMNCQELATAVENDIQIKVMILNNGYLGMVRQWQELFYGRRYSHTNLESKTDFVKLAEAFGAIGKRVTKKEDVRPAIEEAMNIDRPIVIDFVVDREENVFPMVPPGGLINDMLG